MNASSGNIRNLIFKSAKQACRSHPRDAATASQLFVDLLSQAGVRVNRVPDLVLLTFTGALDRSLGDAQAAAWQIQGDLGPMANWLGWRAPQERLAQAA